MMSLAFNGSLLQGDQLRHAVFLEQDFPGELESDWSLGDASNETIRQELARSVFSFVRRKY